jgi:hypothetical protein
MAYASLRHDGVVLNFKEQLSLGPVQVYSDALSATLKRLKDNPGHSYDFLEQLGWEMMSRGLATEERVLLPANNENYQAILKIIEKDLDVIKK